MLTYSLHMEANSTAYYVTRQGREWFAVLDPIAAHLAGHPAHLLVLDGYTTRRAADDAARLALGL